MSLRYDKESSSQNDEYTSYSPPAPVVQPTPQLQPVSPLNPLQSSLGNASLAEANSGNPFTYPSNVSQLQSAYGNAAVARDTQARPSQQPYVQPPGQNGTPAPAITTDGNGTANQTTAPEPSVVPTIKQEPTEKDVQPPGNGANEIPVLPQISDDLITEPSGENQEPGKDATAEDKKTSKEAGAGAAGAPVPAGVGGGVGVGGGAPGERQTAAQAPVPELDTSRSEGLLQSLATVPASAFGQAVDQAVSVTPQIQTQEKADLAAGYPEIERPTGLPRRAENGGAAPTSLPAGNAPDMPGGGSRAGQPMNTIHTAAVGPLPGSQTDTATAEPGDDEGGGWFDWLFGAISRFFGQLPTSDPGVITSAGERPRVDLTGDANPSQAEVHQQTAHQQVDTSRAQADAATTADFGENNVYPTVPIETLRPSYQPSAPPGGSSPAGKQPPALPDDVRAGFDQNVTPSVNAQVNQQINKHQQDRAAYQQRSDEVRAEGDQRLADETARARDEQQAMQAQTRQQVNDGRQRWRDENQQAQQSYLTQASTQRREVEIQVNERTRTAESQADREMTAAETRAENERTSAQARAAEEKRQAENQPRSFWQRVKGAIKDAFAAIRRKVTEIFDALRKKVKEIIEAAKQLVNSIIEAARAAIVEFIKNFGEALKRLVTIAFAAFPETAARARAWIDDKVNAGIDLVNRAAEALKKAASAVLDWVGDALDKALSVLQAAMIFVLNVLKSLAVGFVEILELLAKLQAVITNIAPMIEKIIAIIKDPAPVIEAIKAFIGGMIEKVPGMALDITRGAITFSEPPADHWDGIWSHLKPKLDYLAANWWSIIKQSLWHMIWPFAEDSPLWKDATDFWKTIKLAWADISAGNASKAVDDILRIIQLANNIIGLFYGWAALALILGYAIAGGIAAAEVGVLPGIIAGAGAGAAIAGTVGMYLAVATLVIEGAVLAKAGYNLIFRTQTADENEADYERIAGSGLTMAIVGALFAVGWIAKLVANAILKAVFGRVFRRPALRGRGTTARGDIIEIRVALAARVLAILRGRTVTWLEVLRRNFPVIDLVEDGIITITTRPKRAPLYRITGGRLISVKSSAQTGAALQGEINGWVGELANFNTKGNVSVINPTGRTLVVALQTPVDAATEAAMRLQASGRGVDLQLTTALPPGHPAGVFADQIPAILAEAGVEVSNEVPDGTKDDE